MKWGMVLHFYQPPVQDLAVTKQVFESSYMPVLHILRDSPRVRITANISACLLSQLYKLQKWEFFELVRYLVSRGQLELLSSPAYHPIVPFLQIEDFEMQMLEAEWIYYDTLGFLPGKGFFFPELAVNPEVIDWICGDFYSHTVVDDSAVGASVSSGTVCKKQVLVNNRQLTDIIRAYPKKLIAEDLVKLILAQKKQSVVSVNDVEAFGHHYEERAQLLADLFADQRLEFVTLKELADEVDGAAIEVKASSWQEGKNSDEPFWLWANPDNPLQQKYLELVRLAREVLWEGRSKTEPLTWEAAAGHFNAGMSSCYLYWLSEWPWWHPDVVQKGAEQLIKAVRTVQVESEVKRAAEELYHNFLAQMWLRHWSGEVEKSYESYDKYRSNYINKLNILD